MASVLVVEDDSVLAHCIEAHLAREGFEVDVVGGTLAALDRLDLRKFSAIVTDIVMPRGMPNGLSLARMARVRNPGCHVILISGDADLAKDGELFGAKVFAKPVDLDALTAAIRKDIAGSARGV